MERNKGTTTIPTIMNLLSTRSAGLLLVLVFVAANLQAQPSKGAGDNSPEAQTAAYFDSIKTNPLLVAAFLREMPKGGDLHNHLSGAIYAESLIEWLAEADGCIDPETDVAIPCNRSENAISAKTVMANPVLYRQVVDAWSMRNYELSGQSGHDHFFDTFGKFSYAGSGRLGDKLAEAVGHADRDNAIYVELMLTADGSRALALGGKLGWQDNFGAMREALLANGLRDSLKLAISEMNSGETRMRQVLECNTDEASSACDVEVRYLYQVLRGLAPEQVFAQILTGFELAEMDPRFVGFNLVMPEDYPVPLRDFTLHMHIIDFLRPLYTKAHVSLHAGELAPKLVPPDELCCHIRQSIELGHAERIGHGIDIAYEEQPLELLKMMAERNVMVEICLTSNEVILGVKGKNHPLHLYRSYGVPTALATDDEGVSRIDLTAEFVKAVEEQGLDYLTLKTMARTSLEHAFVPGKSIWSDARSFVMASELRGFRPGRTTHTKGSLAFLNSSEKAKLQWQLEEAFERFEAKIAGSR